VVVVDRSIVRGSTMRQIVAMLFEAGADEVHVRISCPAVVSPCFYGVDMADESDLIAGHRTLEEVREHIGASSLAYLSLEGLQDAISLPATAFCRACLTGSYPTSIPRRTPSKLSFERALVGAAGGVTPPAAPVRPRS